MIAYQKAIDQLGGYFTGYSVEWIERKKNEEADTLSRMAHQDNPLHQASSSLCRRQAINLRPKGD
jgi:hypothetical protein